MLLHHILTEAVIRYTRPNFSYEYNELEHQRLTKLFKSKQGWMKAASTGKEVTLQRSQLRNIQNHDGNLRNLEDDKLARATTAFEGGSVELPILLSDNGQLYLLAGNTRLAYATKHKFPLKVWVVNAPGLEEYL